MTVKTCIFTVFKNIGISLFPQHNTMSVVQYYYELVKPYLTPLEKTRNNFMWCCYSNCYSVKEVVIFCFE